MLSINAGITHLLSSIHSYVPEKKLILEPLCVVIRLIILKYKESGTKISIVNNSISYMEPSFLQGALRTYNGDKREDLHNLYAPIIKAFEWYDIESGVNRYLFEQSLIGIDMLLSAYDKDSIIHHSLVHYKKIVQEFIDGKADQDENVTKRESPLINNLKDIWNISEIKIIYDILKLIDSEINEEEKKLYIKIIEDILSHKEKRVNIYVEKNSHTYS
jgi:hypothetical protein